MEASTVISMESKRLNHLWTELIHDNLRSSEIQIESHSMLNDHLIEVRSSRNYYVNLTNQQLNAKLDQLHDLIFAWTPIMYDLQNRISDQMYFCLLDQNGVCVSTLSNRVGIQCSAWPYLNEQIRSKPIKVRVVHEEDLYNPSHNRVPDFYAPHRYHNVLIYPVPGEGKILGYVGVGNFDEHIPDEFEFIGYLAAKLLEAKFMNIQMLKEYSRLLIHDLPMCALMVDENGRIINISEHSRQFFGVYSDKVSTATMNILIDNNGFKKLSKGGIRDLTESFGIKAAHNQIIPCRLISKQLIEIPECPSQYLLLFEKNKYTVRDKDERFIGDTDAASSAFNRLVGTASSITYIKSLGKKVARVSSNVLIEGESGTGKELLAEAIHIESRRNGPFIPINCGAIPRELMLSELFGYEDGAFTGAKRGGKKGVFEMADGGTVFLDEIEEMPADMQISLLRFLENRIVTRVGSGEPKVVDVRIIAATNRDFNEEVARGIFRQDLFYRLNVFNLHLPPLRERQDDIPDIAAHILENLCKKMDIKQPKIADSVMKALVCNDWPGNVRELKNTLEYALIVCSGDEITMACLPHYLKKKNLCFNETSGSLEDSSKALILQALEQNNGNIAKSAKSLGISRPTLYRKIENMGICIKDFFND